MKEYCEFGPWTFLYISFSMGTLNIPYVTIVYKNSIANLLEKEIISLDLSTKSNPEQVFQNMWYFLLKNILTFLPIFCTAERTEVPVKPATVPAPIINIDN
jgi:hypothetical protein